MIIVFNLLVLLSLVFSNQAVFAEDSLSITVPSDTVSLTAYPGIFASESQTITASTSSTAGYTVTLSPAGSSNSLHLETDPSYAIPTFTIPQGSSSLPAGSTGHGYGFSTDDGANYFAIPAVNTSKQIFKTSSAGTNQHDLTFGILVSSEDPSGDYDGTILLQVVANLSPCSPGKICYYGNNDDGTGQMEDQTASSNSSVMLTPPNFSRRGYGFAGWNTEIDGSGTTYGPSATITTGDLSSEGLQLYAKWIASTGTFQGWEGCDDMNIGDVTALTDTRDGETYAVAKHPDGQCWMMENLRLDLSDEDVEITADNTNRPSADFMQEINNNHPAPTNSFCESNTTACVNKVVYSTNNINRSLTPSYNTNDTATSWFSYGVYYNWYTATAGKGTLEQSIPGASSDGDLCPANWRLPASAGDVGDYSILDRSYGGTGKNQNTGSIGTTASNRWRTYPLNFIYSGEQKASGPYNRGNSGSFTTLNTQSGERTINMWLRAEGISINSNTSPKHRGQPLRCLVNDGYKVNGNIHYDSNGGLGTMPDNVDVLLGEALADYNTFTKPGSVFVTWNSSPDGKGVVIKEGGMVAGAAYAMGIEEGETLTLYAIWDTDYSLVYDGNGADAGSMSSVTIPKLTTGTKTLVAPNYSRTGYSFGGWSLDPNAATKLANGTSVTIYGPNETINITNSFLNTNIDPNTGELKFYAVWIPENTTYTMQTFDATACSALNSNEVISLKDTRDNNLYTVAKLADNNCWMIENLRLDPAGIAFTATNTNSPTSDFITEAVNPNTSSNNTLCKTDNSACDDSIKYNANAINRNLVERYDGNNNYNSWYSYGIMYNWYSATAGNGTYSFTTNSGISSNGVVSGDICPANWRLPTGGSSSSSDINTLNRAVNNGSTSSDAGLVKFPVNLIYSGDYNYNTAGGRSTFARYWTATSAGTDKAYRFGLTQGGNPTPAGSWNKWDAFAVRCLVK